MAEAKPKKPNTKKDGISIFTARTTELATKLAEDLGVGLVTDGKKIVINQGSAEKPFDQPTIDAIKAAAKALAGLETALDRHGKRKKF